MEELLISPYLLAAIFALIAAVYSSVGLGGGSSYTALLAIFNASYQSIPGISLSLNVVVTLIGSVNFARQGHLRVKLIAPLLLGSMPMAYLGGSLDVSAQIYYWVLLGTLVLVAARTYLWKEPTLDLDFSPKAKVVVSLVLGAAIGLISGIVGIGGGIYLVPLILVLDLGTEKEAAAAGALFIVLNSLSGLTAHLQRHVPDIEMMAPLVAAVLVGGLVGSHLGSARFKPATVRRALGAVILVAIALLIRRLV
jgi:uncharacterized membrane protein YfcA